MTSAKEECREVWGEYYDDWEERECFELVYPVSYLMPDGTNSSPVAGALIYMINEMQGDIEDLHSEVSQSSYVAQVSEFSSIATGSFGVISSSLIPDKDDKCPDEKGTAANKGCPDQPTDLMEFINSEQNRFLFSASSSEVNSKDHEILNIIKEYWT